MTKLEASLQIACTISLEKKKLHGLCFLNFIFVFMKGYLIRFVVLIVCCNKCTNSDIFLLKFLFKLHSSSVVSIISSFRMKRRVLFDLDKRASVGYWIAHYISGEWQSPWERKPGGLNCHWSRPTTKDFPMWKNLRLFKCRLILRLFSGQIQNA